MRLSYRTVLAVLVPSLWLTGVATADELFGNILENPGAEQDPEIGWTVVEGELLSIPSESCGSSAGVPVGEKFFLLGTGCYAPGAYAEAVQSIDVSAIASRIDAELVTVVYGGWMAYSWDVNQISIECRDEVGELVVSPTAITVIQAAGWTCEKSLLLLPVGTRSLDVRLSVTEDWWGASLVGHFDGLFIRLDEFDLDGNGAVDFQDLLTILSHWGQPCWIAPCGCQADFDESGFIDFQDLLMLLSNWGPVF